MQVFIHMLTHVTRARGRGALEARQAGAPPVLKCVLHISPLSLRCGLVQICITRQMRSIVVGMQSRSVQKTWLRHQLIPLVTDTRIMLMLT